MTTQKDALKIIKAGGRTHNFLLLDSQGYPKGKLTQKQLTALAGKGLTARTLYDNTKELKAA